MILNNKIKLFIIFIVFFLVFFVAHSLTNGLISSDDPYYHAKHAALMAQTGNLTLIKPWLEYHFFNYAPADGWWGFHLGMALFIYWFGLFPGVKIFVSLLAALIFSTFYLVLNKLKLKYPFTWTLFLFFSSAIFSFRLLLERPHLLSMIVLPLAYLFLVKRKNFWLFALSLVYVLSYHLAPIIILLALVYAAADAYINKRLDLKPLIASAGGILAGILIHPASLNYIYIIFLQSWQILFLKFTGVDLHTGGELQFMNFSGFLNSNFLVLLFYILAAVLFLSLKKTGKNSIASLFLFLCSGFWLLVTLLVPRGAEYWLPTTLIFAAVMFSDFSTGEEFKQIKNRLAGKINLKITGFFLISVLILIIFNNLANAFGDLYYNKTDELGANYKAANGWLKANTKENSIVFYDNWGMWPMMFFYNDYNHYIVGVDPTFLYEYDPRTYWLWRNLSSDGLYCDEPTPCFKISPAEQIKFVPMAIKTVFRAKYAVVANNKTSSLIKTLNSLRAEVRLVFKNKDLLIYEMK